MLMLLSRDIGRGGGEARVSLRAVSHQTGPVRSGEVEDSKVFSLDKGM